MGVMDAQRRAAKDRELPSIEQVETKLPPKRQQINMWTISALQSISTQTLKNAWSHRYFGWFLKTLRTLKYVCNKYLDDKNILTLPCMPFVGMITALV